MFLEVELLLDVVPEQVADLLVVDLQVGGVHQVLHVLRSVDGLTNIFCDIQIFFADTKIIVGNEKIINKIDKIFVA